VLLVLWKLLKGLLTVLKVGKFAVFKGLSRITTLFSSNLGLWGWIVLASVLVFDHQAAIQTALDTGEPVHIIVSYGESLGTSIQNFTGALQQVPQASGWVYAELLWKAVSSAATVLWYFKAFYHISAWVTGDNVPPFYLLAVAGLIYFLVVYAVTGWVPDAGTIEALSNIQELLEFERANPLFDPGNTSNLTNSTKQGVVGDLTW